MFKKEYICVPKVPHKKKEHGPGSFSYSISPTRADIESLYFFLQ